MRFLALLLLVGCATTSDEFYQEAVACKDSLVIEEGVTRIRTADEVERDCGELFERHYKQLDREAFMKRKLVCAEGFVLVCRGISCGRKPRNERELRDYACISTGHIRRDLYEIF